MGVEATGEEIVGLEDRGDVESVDGDSDTHIKKLRPFCYRSADL